MDKIEPIDKDLVDIVAYTANSISKAKGHSITFDNCVVEIILQSLRLVNTLDKVRNEIPTWSAEEA